MIVINCASYLKLQLMKNSNLIVLFATCTCTLVLNFQVSYKIYMYMYCIIDSFIFFLLYNLSI